MKLRHSGLLVLINWLFLLAVQSPAAGLAALAPLPNLDARTSGLQAGSIVSGAQQSAAERLRGLLPSARVDFDPVIGAPISVSAGDRFLSGTNGQGNAISSSVSAGFVGDPHRATKAFLREHNQLFGFGPEMLNHAKVKRDFVTPRSGLKTVVWEQEVDAIPVFEAVFISHTTSKGELVNLTSQFIPDPESAANQGTANRTALVATQVISARQAVAIAAQNLGEQITETDIRAATNQIATVSGPEKRQEFSAAVFKGKAAAKLIWLPVNKGELRLCWDVELMSRTRGEMFRVLVDVQTGEVWLRRCLTDYLSAATYRVYLSDSPSPFSPGYATPVATQPALLSRSILTLSALDTNASPNGWINDGGNETLGNNVDAHTDRNADDVADLPRPQGSPFRVFDFPLDLAQSPAVYTNAAVVQLFYWNNVMHDKLYALGFTEAAGNFQSNNFGRGGLGNDAVQADAQDGSGVNNANFSTPSDGSPGRMQMYLFTGPSPARDGDLDAEIILHEYTHGLSNRRVGGGVGLSALQSRGMGEGWSDFYAMALLSEAGDDVNGVYAYGGYATYQLSGLTQNYYFGIRRYPYCSDMSKNPLTFKDIDPAQASSHGGVPRSPIIGSTANEVHNMGEVWCMTLREARANLINKYGWEVGNQLMLQLVTDGMNLSPANPNFLQARDAILQADLVNNGGVNRGELWTAFAKRGMGFSAISPSSATTTGLKEAFDVPDNLQVSPSTGFSSSGPFGGSFSPACQSYWLNNIGTNALTWVAWATQPWVDVSVIGGGLTSGGSNSVEVCLTPAANGLSPGNYAASVIFSNTVSGMTQTRSVSLYVSPPRVLFFPLDTDPGWSRQGEWAFGKPTGLGGTSHGYPDPLGGATSTNVFGINLSGDYSIGVGEPYYLTAGPFNFTGYTGMKLQFQRWLNADYPPYVYDTIEISTNNTTWTGIWTNGPAEVADSAWSRMSYDISTYADNRAGLYVRWGHRVGSSGAYAYSGWNLDDIEFVGNPTRNLSLSIPVIATEGDGVLNGTVTASPVQTNDLVVSLSSSDTSEVTVPSTVTIAAGQSNAVFALTVIDDGVLDGTQIAAISASSPGYAGGSTNISVFDSATAVLQLVLPATATEGQGVVTGVVQVSAAPAANVTVNLSSSDTTEIQVPGSVIIPSGQTSAVFTATVVDDNQIDGSQVATVTGHVQNWTDGSALITVLDNENMNLTVNLPASTPENAGVLTNAGSVSISGTLTSNLVVSLASDAPSRLTVPSTATIFAGQLSCALNLSLVDNPIQDGNQTVTVTGSASGFTNGSASTLVLDDEVPPAIVTQPANQTVYYSQTAIFAIIANGKSPLNYQWNLGGTNIAGATNTTLTLTNVQFSQAGDYAVLVTNAFGSMLSSNALLTVNPLPPCVPPPPGLVSWWPGEGNANDIAGSNHGTLLNGAGFAVGEVGQAFSFSGGASGVPNPAVQIPYAPGLIASNYSVETWINPAAQLSSSDSQTWIFGQDNGCQLNVQLGSTGVKVAFQFRSSSWQTLVSTNEIPIGMYTHVAGTWDGTTLRLYLNGVLNNSMIPVGAPADSGCEFFIGGTYHPSAGSCQTMGQYFNGLIDEVSYYGRALLPSEVQTIYLVGVGGKCAANAPVITSQPANQTVAVGANATFSVTASGTLPLSYQWTLNGTNLLAATNPMLTLTNVQLSQAGSYAVLVTNLYGSILSSNALLTVNSLGSCATPPAGLVGWWPGEGSANDIIGGNHGILLNGAGFAIGKVGTAFGFSGGADGATRPCVQIPYSPGLVTTNYSVEVWINPLSQITNSAGQSWVFGESLGAQLVARPGTTGVQLAFSFRNSGGGFPSVASTNNLPIGQFSHVVGTWDGNTLRLYVNGALNNQSVPGSKPVASGCEFYIGGTYHPASGGCQTVGQYFNGLVDEVSCYNRALSLSEIQSIYSAGSGGKCPPNPPVIISQPANQTVVVSGTANFAVTVSGSLPLHYQWALNGTNIAGATNTLLTLTNVQFGQAGSYAVLVTNVYGSALSSNALLVVTLDHFAWSPIPSPRFVNVPFAVSIQAQDPANGIFTNFTGTAILGSTNGITVSPSVSGNFVQGVWTGAVVISQTAAHLVLQADDGVGHFGMANPINVVSLPQLGMVHSGNIALFLWPVGYSGFVLEVSGSLLPAAWTPVPYSPIQIGDQYLLPLDMTGTNDFYRLRFPGP